MQKYLSNTRGYTYLFFNGTHYKIGITTKTPQQRISELQTGSPTKITVSAYSYNQNALKMEQWLHQKFSTKRLEGEWFDLSSTDVATIHYHFENNYLDEYYAPLSKKALDMKEKLKNNVEKLAFIYTKSYYAKEKYLAYEYKWDSTTEYMINRYKEKLKNRQWFFFAAKQMNINKLNHLIKEEKQALSDMQEFRIYTYKTNAVGKCIKDTDGNYILQKLSIAEAKRELIKKEKDERGVEKVINPIGKLLNKFFGTKLV